MPRVRQGNAASRWTLHLVLELRLVEVRLMTTYHIEFHGDTLIDADSAEEAIDLLADAIDKGLATIVIDRTEDVYD